MITFKFLDDNIYSYTIKSNLALENLAKLVFWSMLSFKNCKVSTLVSRFYEETKRNILQIFRALEVSFVTDVMQSTFQKRR